MSNKKIKPELEDILFLNKHCQHDIEYENKVFNPKNDENVDGTCPSIKINDRILENAVIEELKRKHYPKFVKYFKSNSEDCILKSVKNSEKSVEMRIKGNALFGKKEHNATVHGDIWELYSKSVALAPLGSKELVLAFDCRSNLLLHFKKYEDCIKDIDRVLAMTDFDLLKVKLLCRKITCFVAMNKAVAEKEELWKILEHHFEKIDGAFKDEKFLKMIEQANNDVATKADNELKDEPKYFTTITSFPNAKLTLNDNDFIMANCDFSPGEAVIVTKPTIASVNPDHFYAYCSHCLSFTWAGVPCDQCSLCMYCSEKCKEEAWNKYHVLECKVSPHINFSHSIYYQLHNAIKIFLMGVRECGSVSKLLEKIQDVLQFERHPDLMENDKLFQSEFLRFYCLPRKTYDAPCSLSVLAKNACFLMAYLTQTLGNIFGGEVRSAKGKELAKDKDFIYSAVVILHLLMSYELYNNYSDQRKYDECPKYKDIKFCQYRRCCIVGNAYHYFKGFIKKSCDPNVHICHTEDGRIIYFCVQPIKKMEEITIAQTVPFYQKDTIERHVLKPCNPSIHEFCRCIACVKNWPAYLTDFRKFKAQYLRRLSKVQTKGTEIMKKYMEKMAQRRGEPLDYFKFNADGLQELAKETGLVVSTCGQPSFASSWMILTLYHAFKQFHGDSSMHSHIPKSC